MFSIFKAECIYILIRHKRTNYDCSKLEGMDETIFSTNACMLSCFSHVCLCVTLWTAVLQAPLSMGFSRPEHWSGLPCLPLGDLPDTGIQLPSLTSPAFAGRFFTTSATWEDPKYSENICIHIINRQYAVQIYKFISCYFKKLIEYVQSNFNGFNTYRINQCWTL